MMEEDRERLRARTCAVHIEQEGNEYLEGR